MTKSEAPLTIREATEIDVPLLLALTHAAFEEYRTIIDSPTRAHTESLEDVYAALERGGAAIAEIGGNAVGAIRYELHSFQAYIYLGRIAVLSAHRHKGIGRALISWVEQKARSLGFTEARLGTYRVLTRNITLYQSLGYQITGYLSRPGQTDDIVLMKKVL
jgi:GNAT superfamily N-acetyltransferase